MLKQLLLKSLVGVIAFLYRLYALTYRYELRGLENLNAAKTLSPHKCFIFGVWHQNTLSGSFQHRNNGYVIIVSSSKDGDIITQVLHSFGYKTVRGSSRRGGSGALLGLFKSLKRGETVAITMDGPTGPIHQIKPGILELAKKTGTPILPYVLHASRFYEFNSWDRFRIPKMFSKVLVNHLSPVYVDPHLNEEELNQLKISLEKLMLDEENKLIKELNS